MSHKDKINMVPILIAIITMFNPKGDRASVVHRYRREDSTGTNVAGPWPLIAISSSVTGRVLGHIPNIEFTNRLTMKRLLLTFTLSLSSQFQSIDCTLIT